MHPGGRELVLPELQFLCRPVMPNSVVNWILVGMALGVFAMLAALWML